MSAQTMVVAGRSDGSTQNARVVVETSQDGHKEEEETEVLLGTGTGFQQVFLGVGGDGPVAVFSTAIDTLEWFLMEESL